MKSTTKMNLLSKTSLLATSGILIFSLAVSSCKKKETKTTEEPQVITTDDASDVVTYAMQSGSGGYSEQVSDGANYTKSQGYKTTSDAEVLTLTCGVPFDTTIVHTHTGTINASYTHKAEYLLNCSAVSVPQSITYSGSYSGNYDGPAMSSTNTGSRNWSITGINPGATTYTYSGTLSRSGSHTSKVRNKYTFTSDLQIATTNLTVNKSTYRITGGTAAVTVTCTVSDGTNYSFTGTLVFNGNNTATLTINGTAYTINLY